MSRYRLSGTAQQDLREIAAYVARDSRSRALRLVDALLARLPMLADNPGMGRGRPELGHGIRSFPVSSYLIFYRETLDGVEIVRVVHGARDIEDLFS